MRIFTRKIQDILTNLGTGNPTPVMQRNHQYKYMCVGGAARIRMPVYVYFDNPRADPQTALLCWPGDIIPVRDYDRSDDKRGVGREVYVIPICSLGSGSTDGNWTAESLQLIFLEEQEESSVFLRKYIEGEKIVDVAADAISLAADGSQVLLDSDTLRNHNVGAAFLQLHLEGGGSVGDGSGGLASATAFPLELRLREYHRTNGTPGRHSRVFLFPGNIGYASLVIPVAQHMFYSQSDAATYRWVLEAYNPVGNTMDLAEARVLGALYAGVKQEAAVYVLSGRETNIAPNGDTRINSILCATMAPKYQGYQGYMRNNAGVAAMAGANYIYIDSMNGGPYYIPNNMGTIVNAAGAGAQFGSGTNPNMRHMVSQIAWAAAGTGLSYAASLAVEY